MTTIWVTFQVEGWHCWPSPTREREYLKQPHRHMFHFRLEVQVRDLGREVEFHNLKEWATQWMHMNFTRKSLFGLDFEDCSCERLAEMLCSATRQHWKASWAACEVSEDGECGAAIELSNDPGELNN